MSERAITQLGKIREMNLKEQRIFWGKKVWMRPQRARTTSTHFLALKYLRYKGKEVVIPLKKAMEKVVSSGNFPVSDKARR